MIPVKALSGRSLFWPATVLLLFAGAMAIADQVRPAEGANDARTVRRLMTTTIQSESGVEITHADVWTLTDDSGAPVDFLGIYTDENGNVTQIQRRTPEGEQVWWSGYTGRPGEPLACVEAAPPAPNGMVVLPRYLTEDEVLAYGYTPTSQPAGAFSATPAHVQVDAQPVTVTDYTVDSGALWSATIDLGEGATRHRLQLLAPDGLVSGFWSTAHDASGAQVFANASTTSRIETYEASVFQQVASTEGVPTDAVPCN